MHFIRKDFITFQDKLYYIVKIVREDDKPIVDNLKEYLQADIVLKKEEKFYFLRNIPDIDIIT
jgi:hypothetical protein|tara:strand:+ start:486 stop:674 length:189 start_codon:yes stop_codon:yes gene_type:complete